MANVHSPKSFFFTSLAQQSSKFTFWHKSLTDQAQASETLNPELFLPKTDMRDNECCSNLLYSFCLSSRQAWALPDQPWSSLEKGKGGWRDKSHRLVSEYSHTNQPHHHLQTKALLPAASHTFQQFLAHYVWKAVTVHLTTSLISWEHQEQLSPWIIDKQRLQKEGIQSMQWWEGTGWQERAESAPRCGNTAAYS